MLFQYKHHKLNDNLASGHIRNLSDRTTSENIMLNKNYTHIYYVYSCH